VKAIKAIIIIARAYIRKLRLYIYVV